MAKVAVQLESPRLIAGKLRRPQEGPIMVAADEAKLIEKEKAGEIVKDEKPAKAPAASA
ncbi:MAG TPA: hypothetical protein VMQ93_16255 [Novosphingobium sp.]|nr:hypothetical protein [Novosphingobium sp.]